MPQLCYPFDFDALMLLKRELALLPVRSKASHRCEAFSKACGFNTYAALRATTREGRATLGDVEGARFYDALGVKPSSRDLKLFDLAVIKALVARISAKNERFGAVGNGIGPREKKDGKLEPWATFNARLKASRDEAASTDFAEQVWTCLIVLHTVGKTKTVNPNAGSYSMKHRIERVCVSGLHRELPEYQFIWNGAVIYAATLLGFTYKSFPHLSQGPNVGFNMNIRDLKAIEARVPEAVAI